MSREDGNKYTITLTQNDNAGAHFISIYNDTQNGLVRCARCNRKLSSRNLRWIIAQPLIKTTYSGVQSVLVKSRVFCNKCGKGIAEAVKPIRQSPFARGEKG